ncbi:tetratricopeptide repeat protein [Okeania sp. KiyG1]|uniref:tetratricopeptide repeat protein n=1 Tax=Okeania sp. KiyG1 TaxID=2720165 RepID=UPI0019214A41|nr:tetratricopeptide repeat protein [Okeania sp. KiyG1]GGA35205.1 hypothetical protein CYANOKiyG1_52790 [Okeania sp. KiyG1]
MEKSLKLEPDNVITISNYANALMKSGKTVESFPFFIISLQGIIGYANYLIKSGKTQESLLWFEQALKLDPDNIDAIFNYANALIKLEKIEESLPYLKKLYSLSLIMSIL